MIEQEAIRQERERSTQAIHELACIVAGLSASPDAAASIRRICARNGTPAIVLADARWGAEWAAECLPIGVIP